MQRSGATEGDHREVARVDAALDRYHAHGLGHLGVRDSRDARGRFLERQPELVAEPADRALRRLAVELHVARERRAGIEIAEQQVRVGDRRLLAAAAVAGRTGVGPGGMWAHAQGPAGVAPGDAAAAGAHRVDVDHRQRERAAADLAAAAHLDAAVERDRHVAGRASHVEPDDVARAGQLGHRRGADGAAGRARQHGPGAVAGGRGRVCDAAAREHDLGHGEPLVAGPLGEPLEVAAQQGGEGGVDDRGGAALVLAEHAGGLVGGGDVGVGEGLAGQLGHPPLVLWMAEAPEQADRHRLGVELAERLAQLVLLELAQHAIRAAALGDGHAQLGGHERRRVAGAEAVEVRACLTAELLEVDEALGGEQRRRSHLALEQGVGADGHAVDEALDVPGLRAGLGERFAHRVRDPLGLVLRRGGRLACHRPLVRQQDGVGEGAAHVHPENHLGVDAMRFRRPPPSRRPRGACATGSTSCPAAAPADTRCPCACWRDSTPGSRRT